MPLSVTFVLPCLNEEKTITVCIGQIQTVCEQNNISAEIIVSDNMSEDNSASLASAAGARVITAPVRGYGAALDAGIKEAKNDIVVFADADLSYPFAALPAMIEPIIKGEADFVLGNRLKGNIEKGAMPFLNRYLGTPVLSFLIRHLYNIDVWDCNGGMRALKRDCYAKLGLVNPGMEYASEMLISAAKNNLKYKEVIIDLKKDGRGRPPHLKRWKDGMRHLITIFKNLGK